MADTEASGVGPPYDMNYFPEPLDAMYPDIYHRVYPVVKQMCEIYDRSSHPGFYPYPTREAVEEMAEHIYQRVSSHMDYHTERQIGRNLLRALILILLIRELLRRRGSF